MQRCIFNDIVEGKMPSYKVYEDEQFYAFLDAFPRTKGHTLVVPKTQYRWTYDVPNFGEYWEIVLKVTKAMQKGLAPVWINYLTFGLEVPYAHVHILPRYTPVDEKAPAFPPEVLQFGKKEFEAIAEQIRAAF